MLSSSQLLRQNLILLRDRHNITQEQAAAVIGVEYKYYQSIETGRRAQIRLVTLDKLAHAFGLTGAGLLSETLPPSFIPPTIVPLGRLRAKPTKRRRIKQKALQLTTETASLFSVPPDKMPKKNAENEQVKYDSAERA